MRKLCFLLCCLVFLSSQILAQTKTITGTVTDAGGLPVAAASVTIKGSNQGTSTGADGTFTLSVPTTAKTLVISAINFTTLEINVQNTTNIGKVTLQAGNQNLNEVVVVGYGTQKKTNVTGAVATVSGDKVADRPFTSVDKTLQGAVAGLQVASTSGAPGSNTDIRIRGIGSISAGAAPLWVIDGVIATTGDLTTNTTTANVLSTLNPDDIESISVLKDASATSIYGSRAANGVILVTTKKGRAGKTRFTAVGEAGANSQAYNPSNKSMTTLQTRDAYRMAVINAGEATDNASADAFINANFGVIPNYQNTSTNWLDVVTRTGAQQQYNLSMSAGTDKTQIYASGGFFKQVGTVIASDFKRYNGAVAVTHKAGDIFTFNGNLSISSALQNTPANGGAFANPVLASYFLLPWYTPRNSDGSLRYGDHDDLGEFPVGGGVFNPVVQAEFNNNPLRQTTVRGSFSGELKLLDNLRLTSRYGGEYFDVSEDQYRNPFYGDGQANGGDGFSSYKRIYDWTWTNFLDYRQTLNRDKDIYFDVKAGYESQQVNQYLLQAGGQTFPQTLQLKALAVAGTPTTATALPQGSATASYFATGNINFKDKYIVAASFRRDGSSVFGVNHQYGSFWSVAGSWNLNEEEFIKNALPTFSLLKLRASYGTTGNQNGFGYYTPQASYQVSSTYAYIGQPGSALTNPGNPDLTWEKNNAYNIGLDFGLLKNRLTGTLEYYHRKTSDMVLLVPLSYTTGIVNPINNLNQPLQNQNVGSMTNKGIEITLSGKPVVTRDFSWTINFNIAHNINRVTALYNNNPIASTNGNFQYTVGHDLLTYYLRQWAGVNPADGTPQWYTDSSKKTLTGTYANAKQTLNYSASPKWYGALGTTLTYKGISLDAQFNYNFGNYLYDTWGSYLNSDGLYYGSFGQMSRQLNAWKKPGDVTDVPQLIDGGNHNSYRGSTRFLYKGNFIRLRNIQLSYTIPTALVTRWHLGSITAYVRGANLWTFATDKNLPYDPESGIYSNTNLDVFIPKTITGGLKIGF
ncbi:MAG: TonB-dependent receptor [Bacteroidetes bacterium]|nr:TonB-dependent receptor [Bacteroidota bacterium]